MDAGVSRQPGETGWQPGAARRTVAQQTEVRTKQRARQTQPATSWTRLPNPFRIENQGHFSCFSLGHFRAD
jgi:hypothetical protein